MLRTKALQARIYQNKFCMVNRRNSMRRIGSGSRRQEKSWQMQRSTCWVWLRSYR